MLNPRHEPTDNHSPVTTPATSDNVTSQEENRAIKHALGDPRLSIPTPPPEEQPAVSTETLDYFTNPHPGNV